jgi:hypothetical protein
MEVFEQRERCRANAGARLIAHVTIWMIVAISEPDM